MIRKSRKIDIFAWVRNNLKNQREIEINRVCNGLSDVKNQT